MRMDRAKIQAVKTEESKAKEGTIMYKVSEVDRHTCPQITPGDTPEEAATNYASAHWGVAAEDIALSGDRGNYCAHLARTSCTLPLRVS